MQFAHLTDLHLPIPVRPAWSDLLNKRALGYFSWARVRRFRHRIDALDRIASDCRRVGPAFTAISGDLVNIALQSEFMSGVQWLAENFDPRDTAFTPGNHDAYVALPFDKGLKALASYMAGVRADGAMRAPADETDFPFVRSIDDLSFVFANSSPPTAPGLATGRLGRDQIDRLGAVLCGLRDKDHCRILILHHPITNGATPRRKALDDAGALRALLKETGVDLVLHGHTHRSILAHVETKDGPRPVVGGASASHPCAHGAYRPARYNLFSVERGAPGAWRIDLEIRELDPADGEVKTAERRRLLPAPA